MNLRYQIRRDTAANWASANPVLRSGELGLETDTYKLKAGDGTSAWSALGYLGGGVTDHGAMTGLGDDDHTQYLRADGTRSMTGSLNLGGNALTNGTVSGSLLDIGSVPLNRVTGIADNTLLGNNAGVNGPPVALTAAQVRAEINVEDGATADQTGAEIKTAYEAEADTNAFTDAEQTKLAGIETGATNTNDPLADANQTITASRTIDDGNNGYQFFVDLANGTASTAQVLVNPTTPQVTLSANNGTNTFIVQNNGAAVNFICSATSTVQLNSDPGADGECFISQGASAAPVYDGFSVHVGTSAPTNTSRLWLDTNMSPPELCTYDSARGHWFGPPVLVSFGKSNSTGAGVGHFLYSGSNGTTATSQERGWLAPWDGTVTGWAYHSQTTLSGWTIRLDKNDGSGTNTTGFVSRSVNTDRFNDMTVDGDFGSGNVIGAALVSGTNAIANSTLTVRLQRRAS